MVYMLSSRKKPWPDYRPGPGAEPIIVCDTIPRLTRQDFQTDAVTILNVWERREHERR